MPDIFLKEDVRRLLNGKKVIFMGDSNVRSYYKDLLCLYNNSAIIPKKILVAKMENSVYADKLQTHGEKNNSRRYQEERVFHHGAHHFEFYFLTRVYNEYVEDVLNRITIGKKPDVVVINSCLWDLARWGPKGVEEFKANLMKLMKRLKDVLDEKCLVIWATAPPLAGRPYGGFLVVELDFLKYSLRFHVMEANAYAKKVAVHYGYDVLDIHYHLRMQTHLRCPDGIHWPPLVVRYITNLMLTHISLAWDAGLPNRVESCIVEQATNCEPIEAKTISQNELSPMAPPPSKKRKKAAWKRKQVLLKNPKPFPAPVAFRSNMYCAPPRPVLLQTPEHNSQFWHNTLPPGCMF